MKLHCTRAEELRKSKGARRERKDNAETLRGAEMRGESAEKIKVLKQSERKTGQLLRQDGDKQEGLSPVDPAQLYFFAAADLAAASAYFLVKRSTRPAVSISFCLPVKNGWQFEQISTRSMSPLMVERVWNVWPQAQCTVTG